MNLSRMCLSGAESIVALEASYIHFSVL
jgi:hypothetical protein